MALPLFSWLQPVSACTARPAPGTQLPTQRRSSMQAYDSERPLLYPAPTIASPCQNERYSRRGAGGRRHCPSVRLRLCEEPSILMVPTGPGPARLPPRPPATAWLPPCVFRIAGSAWLPVRAWLSPPWAWLPAATWPLPCGARLGPVAGLTWLSKPSCSLRVRGHTRAQGQATGQGAWHARPMLRYHDLVAGCRRAPLLKLVQGEVHP